MTDITGITLTGGEPFQQADRLHDLIDMIRADPLLDVLIFTGMTAEAARFRNRHLFDAADALICGPYRSAHLPRYALRSSANQELVINTELGHQRFAELTGAAFEPNFQVSTSSTEVHLVGLGRPGELQSIAKELRDAGVSIVPSWEPEKS